MASEKLLSVSVAAYNVEDTLVQCLESCVVPSHMDELEVIVVDDGSKDGTAQVAQGFVDRYPQTFKLLRKENGGYGTTVNAAMKAARGAYIRLLDGDDWFDTDGLVALLETLKDADEDWIITNIARVDEQTGEREVRAGVPVHLRGGHGALDRFTSASLKMGMWYSTFKTALAHTHPFELPGRRLYTDALFMAHMLRNCQTWRHVDAVLYNYRVNVGEAQSTSVESTRKHYRDLVDNYHEVLEMTLACDPNEHPAVEERLKCSYLKLLESLYLLPPSRDTLQLIKELERELKQRSRDLWEYVGTGHDTKTLSMMRKTGYLFYWVKTRL